MPATRQLVQMGANPDVIDLTGQTPLYYAIKAGRFEMVEYLLKMKVNLHNVDLRGKTLTSWAKTYSKTQILELLLANGAPPISDNRGNNKKQTEKKEVE